MGNLKIRSQVLGIVGTNCYLAFDYTLRWDNFVYHN